jgi:uncharacterized protein (TIGR00369 family)
MTHEDIIKRYDNNRFAQTCGIHVEREPGGKGLVANATLMPGHLNGSGHVHGGFIYTMADTAGGSNARLYANSVTTLDSDFHFLTNNATRELTGRAELIREGGSVIVLRVRVLGDTGDIFGEGTFTYYVLD